MVSRQDKHYINTSITFGWICLVPLVNTVEGLDLSSTIILACQIRCGHGSLMLICCHDFVT